MDDYDELAMYRPAPAVETWEGESMRGAAGSWPGSKKWSVVELVVLWRGILDAQASCTAKRGCSIAGTESCDTLMASPAASVIGPRTQEGQCTF